MAHLLARGAEVVGISRSPEEKSVYLPYRWDAAHQNFRFEQADLNKDLPRVLELLQEWQPDYVVNFVAQGMVAESWKRPVDWFQTNVVAQVALHDALRQMTFLKKYLHVGTPEVYGNCEGSITEDQPFKPSTPYAVSRAAADLSLRTFVSAYGFPVVTTRAANVYGPGQRLYRIIPRSVIAIRRGGRIPLHGGGTSVRSFIHIRDVAEGTRLAAVHGQAGDCFHLATLESLSIRALVQRICERMNVAFDDAVDVVDERQGKDHAYLLSSDRARTRLGWHDTVTLDAGIDETIAWVDRHVDTLAAEPHEYIHRT